MNSPDYRTSENSKFCFYRKLNLKVSEFYFESFCYFHEVQSSFSQNELFLPFRKYIFRRITPLELTFSGFVVLLGFRVLPREIFHPMHFVEVMH